MLDKIIIKHITLLFQDKRLTAVRGKKYLQVAKNRYSGDLGIVPLDFDKDSLSYQSKKKSKKQDDPEKLVNPFDGYCIDETYSEDIQKNPTKKNARISKKDDSKSFLSDILDLDSNR